MQNPLPENIIFLKMAKEHLREYVDENLWKVRDCEDYKIEYDECKAFRTRFHQYFVNGEFLDCKKWYDDYVSCKKCEKKEDLETLYKIILHEDERKEKRIKGQLNNDVWKKRETPNPEWNAELPDWKKEQQKNSFSMSDIVNEEKQCIVF